MTDLFDVSVRPRPET